MLVLKICGGVTAAIWLGIAYFLVVAIGNGTAEASSTGWFIILVVPPMLIYGGLSLRAQGRGSAGTAVLCLSVPVALFCLLIARLISWDGRWS